LASSVVRIARLAGASSSAVHRVQLADGRSLVVRRYVWRQFMAEEPEAPSREGDALRFAGAHGLAVPELVALDATGQGFGDGTPTLVMTFLHGRPVAGPDLEMLATAAAAIHEVNADQLGHDYAPWYQDTTTEPPAGAARPELWERALERWQSVPPFAGSLIHRDFHPGNVLWSRHRISGVVDWVNACRGPWQCDIAHCRDQLIQLRGFGCADRFLDAYLRLTGRVYDPFWELASVLEHDAGWWNPERINRAEKRLGAALATGE
jgi:Ser/Thr protein kinase RdoA (MazF antagonist)